MSILYATEIDCLLSRTLGDEPPYMGKSVRWLGVIDRDELPDVKMERRPFALVLNTDLRSKPGSIGSHVSVQKKGPSRYLIHLDFILLATV